MRIGGGIKKFFISVISTFLVVEILFLISPQIITSAVNKEQILQLFQKQTGEKLLFDKFSIKTYPDFTVKINAEKPEIENIFKADTFEIKFGLPKLIFKKFSINDLKTENLKLYIVRNKDNSTNLDKIIYSSPFTLDLENIKINFSSYKLFFADKVANQNIIFEGEKIYANIKKDKIEFETKGYIKGGHHTSDIDLSLKIPNINNKRKLKDVNKYFLAAGHIKNFHPEIFKEYIKLFDKDFFDIQGTINAEFTPYMENEEIKSEKILIVMQGLKFLNKKNEKSIIFSKKDIIKSNVIFKNRDLIIEDFEFLGDKFKICMDGKIHKWGTKSPNADLNINIDNAKVEELYWMLPSNLFTEELEILKIKKYGAYADAKGKLEIKGDIFKPEVYGYVDFDNLWALDGFSPDVPKAVVKTKYRKDKVDVDVKVWATPTEYVTVKGWSDFFDLSKNEYQINSTQNVPLAEAEKYLVPVSDVLGFIIGPVPIMDIKGYGNIDLFVSGSKEEPYLKGNFRYKNATASFNDINLKLEKAFGGVDFNKDKVSFYTDKGYIWGQPASIKGISDAGVNIDYKAEVNNVQIKDIITTLKTSPLIENLVRQIYLIDSADGKADLKLNITGKMKISEVKKAMTSDVMKYFNSNGELNIKNGNILINNPIVNLSKVNGLVKFDLNNIKPDLTAYIFDSPIIIKGFIGKKSDLMINSKKMNLRDSIKLLTGMNFVNKNNIELNDISGDTAFIMDMKYKGSIDNIEYDKLRLSADFPIKSKSDAVIDILSGNFILNNGNVILKNINSKFYNTTAKMHANVSNIFHKPVISGDFSIAKLDLKMINIIKNSEFLPYNYRQILNAYKNYKGDLSAKINIKNNIINGNIWLRNIEFIHAALDYPFSIKSADFNFKNNNFNIKSFNASFAGTPIFMKGDIKNILKVPDFDIYFTSKLSSDFVDNYINTNLSYPIKIAGEILLSSQIRGKLNSLNIYPTIKIEEGADISYMGANFGDTNFIREIKGELKYIKDNLIIKNLNYSKYIYSQNNKLYPLLLVNVKSDIKFLKNKIFINNMALKTFNPINANIFNAVFKKSLIKDGKITCDINIKGVANNPKITGDLDIKNLQIPSFDTAIDDLYISLSPKYINAELDASYLGSDVDATAKIENNNFNIIHFNNLEIHSKKLNLDRLLHSLNEISYSRPIQILGQNAQNETIPFDFKKLLIDNGKWIIDDIVYKSLQVNNFTGKLKFKNNKLILEDVLLDIAGGKLNGQFNYNFDNATIYAKTEAKGVDANEMALAFFDIKNQIYGKLNGQVELTTFGANDEEQKKNLNGILSFSINEGKMPKLGSIEYLLRAGNLIKSGISGLTLNNIKSILIPINSGEFDTIKGKLDIEKGLAKNIKIYSKGQNLSILIFGNYDIPTSIADIYILGKLSKNINSILGPIGNASLNSLFNLIPGIHLDETKDTDLIKQINSIPELGLPAEKFRIFRVKIDGDINSDEFVNTFEWLDK